MPTHIKAGYLRCSVRPFIPNPLRCFQCQRFGHSKASCRGSAVCPRCAEPDHVGAECTAPIKCTNCKGDHTAFSRSCPQWIKEKEIQTVKVTENISFFDARKRVESRTPRAGLSYAAAAKVCRTISTQTDPPSTVISQQPKTPKTNTSHPKSPKAAQTPKSVPSGFVQKPLNKPLPHHKLQAKTQSVPSSHKSRKHSPSPAQKRTPKYSKSTAQTLTKKVKNTRLPDEDVVSLHPSEDEESFLESDDSAAAMELSDPSADASGIHVPLPSSS